MVFIPYQKSLWLTRWHVFFKILKIGRAAETMGRVKKHNYKIVSFLDSAEIRQNAQNEQNISLW